MQRKFADDLYRAISKDRLNGYHLDRNVPVDAELFAPYAWNIALSESLYPALQAAEIVLRNNIHHALCGHYRTVYWFDGRSGPLRPSEQAAVQNAKESLKRAGKPLEPGRIVAELRFGFWTSLLDVRYEQVLWPKMLKACFPNMPRRLRTRKTLSRRLHRIRYLRNRVFHHEPMWHWRDLDDQHRQMLETIGWMNPAMPILVRAVDRFTMVHHLGPGSYLEAILRHANQT